MNIQPDFEELLRLLEEHHVDYMIVGGYAVAFHGHPRFTKDMDMNTMKKWPLTHPGEILLEEFLRPMGVSQYRLAHDIGVSPRRINEVVHGDRAITANTALRLGRYFGTSAQFWLNLQAHYDLEAELDKIGHRLEREVHALASA